MIHRIVSLIVVICLSLACHGIASDITIGLSLPLTGKYTELGKMQQKGFLLWQRHVNGKGGILGKKVDIIIQDDQSSKDEAVKIYTKLIEREKVDFVIGPYSSGISEAILPIAEKNHYPILLSGASADRLWEKGYQYAFGVYTPASKYTVGFLQMLVKYQLSDLAIVSADDAFSVSLSEATRKWAKRFKLKIKYFHTFEKGLRDLTDIASQAKMSGSNVMIVCGHLNESIDMRRALKKIGWFPKAYYASVGPATQKFQTILKEDADLVFSSSQWEKEVGTKFPRGEKFIEAFNHHYKIFPSYHAATAYAAGMILETALKKNDSLDREGLRNILSKLDTMTVIGRYGVDTKGKQKRHFPLIIQWQNSKKNVVWPDSLKNVTPRFE